MPTATPSPQPQDRARTQAFAMWNSTRGIWETSQLDLFAHLAPYSAIWPTCGWMHDGSAYQLRLSALLTPVSGSSSSPTALLRTPLASDSSRGGETLDQVKARKGTIALSHQIIDMAIRGAPGSPARQSEPTMLWTLIGDIFDTGDAMRPPSPDGRTSPDDQHPHPRS